MKRNNLFDCVQCVKHGLSKNDANRLEEELIAEYQPKFNRKHTQDYAFACGHFDEDDLFVIKYLMRPFGATWSTVADAFGTSYDIARNSQRRKFWSSI